MDPDAAYRLVRLTMGRHDPIPITFAEYSAIAAGMTGIFGALALEEKFNLLLENYLEYEQELLTMAARNSLFSQSAWGSCQGEMFVANRRLVNFLTATRLYHDHVDHQLVQLYGRDAPVHTLYRSLRAEATKNDLAWRAIEVLRNVVQHREFPIHELSLEMSSDREDPEKWYARHSVHPSLSVSALQRDARMSKADRAVVAELAAKGEKLQVTPMIRAYVGAVAKLHESVREAMASDITKWESAVTAALDRAREILGDVFAIGAARIVVCDDGDEELDVVEVFEDPMNRRRSLASRTGRARSVATGYVSNKPKPKEV